MSTTTALIADMVDAGVPADSILGPSALGVIVVKLCTGGTLRITETDGVFHSELRNWRGDRAGIGTMQPAKIVSLAVERAAR